MPPIGEILAIAGGHEQTVSQHQFIKHPGRSVIPGRNPFGRVPAEHDKKFGLPAEKRARLACDVDVQAAVRHGRREPCVPLHQRLQQSASLIEPRALEFLVR